MDHESTPNSAPTENVSNPVPNENKLTIPEVIDFKQKILAMINTYIEDYHLEKTSDYPKDRMQNQHILEQMVAHFGRLRNVYTSTYESDDEKVLSDAEDDATISDRESDVQVDDLVAESSECTSSDEDIFNKNNYTRIMDNRTYVNRNPTIISHRNTPIMPKPTSPISISIPPQISSPRNVPISPPPPSISNYNKYTGNMFDRGFANRTVTKAMQAFPQEEREDEVPDDITISAPPIDPWEQIDDLHRRDSRRNQITDHIRNPFLQYPNPFETNTTQPGTDRNVTDRNVTERNVTDLSREQLYDGPSTCSDTGRSNNLQSFNQSHMSHMKNIRHLHKYHMNNITITPVSDSSVDPPIYQQTPYERIENIRERVIMPTTPNTVLTPSSVTHPIPIPVYIPRIVLPTLEEIKREYAFITSDINCPILFGEDHIQRNTKRTIKTKTSTDLIMGENENYDEISNPIPNPVPFNNEVLNNSTPMEIDTSTSTRKPGERAVSFGSLGVPTTALLIQEADNTVFSTRDPPTIPP
jgi:hypothetical protein